MSDNTPDETRKITFTPEDLVQAIVVIDEAAKEGAFKGWESYQKAINARERLVMFANQWTETLKEANKQALAQAASSENKGNDND